MVDPADVIAEIPDHLLHDAGNHIRNYLSFTFMRIRIFYGDSSQKQAI
jgi:hypothetical protein